jgi:hypothetical protein
MITIDLKDFEKAAKDLKTFADKAVPFAVRNALNSGAFEGRKLWQAEMGDEFILRNRFTANSIRIDKATGFRVNTMSATLGSVAPYMRTQEFGGRKAGGGRHGMPIPTSVAAGQGMGTNPRTKLVRGPNKLGAIRLTKGRKGGNRKQRNAVAMRMAIASGSKFVFLELEKSKGIFKITGGRRKPQLRMVWDISRHAVTIPPHPTLGPAIAKLQPKLMNMHYDAIIQQLRRHGILGY